MRVMRCLAAAAVLRPRIVLVAADAPSGQGGDYALLSVIDEGSGMSEDVRARAFGALLHYRAPSNASGLGLSMVYGFVKQSGGFVSPKAASAEAPPCVCICPVILTSRHARLMGSFRLNQHQRSAGAPSSSAVPEADGGALKILFVEDDPAAHADRRGDDGARS